MELVVENLDDENNAEAFPTDPYKEKKKTESVSYNLALRGKWPHSAVTAQGPMFNSGHADGSDGAPNGCKCNGCGWMRANLD